MSAVYSRHLLGQLYRDDNPLELMKQFRKKAVEEHLIPPLATIVADYAQNSFPLGTDHSPEGISRLVRILSPLADEALKDDTDSFISETTRLRCVDLFVTKIINLTSSQGEALREHPEFKGRLRRIESYAWTEHLLQDLKDLNLSPDPIAWDFQALINHCNANTQNRISPSVAYLLHDFYARIGCPFADAMYGMVLQVGCLAFPDNRDDHVYQELIKEANIQIPPDMMARCHNTIGRFNGTSLPSNHIVMMW